LKKAVVRKLENGFWEIKAESKSPWQPSVGHLQWGLAVVGYCSFCGMRVRGWHNGQDRNLVEKSWGEKT
jgi:hypothetical protein